MKKNNKIKQYTILSFNSSFLRAKKYDLTLDYQYAQRNNLLITISNSQLTETIVGIRDYSVPESELEQMIQRRAYLKRKIKDESFREEYFSVSEKLKSHFFIKEIISVTFEHNAHFKNLSKKGFLINGKKYVHFMAGAGQLRRKTVLFIDENILEEVNKRFYNGINTSKDINMSKFGAYFGLYSSSGKKVRTPNYVVVKDFKFIKKELVDFVTEENNVEQREMDLEVNSFDGMGLISPKMGEAWSFELGLPKIATQFIFRGSFTKGLLVSFPFHLLAEENGITSIEDLYGNFHNIKDVDVILTESQFKMASYYSSVEEHKENSKINKLNWYVTRTNPENDKTSFWTSYQYIQVLKDNTNIESLACDTVKFFENVSYLDRNSSILYLYGDANEKKFDIDEIDNYYLKLLLLSEESIKDPYVRNYLTSSLNKKIRESYTGKLLMEGNYSFLIIDPLALAEHALGMKVEGILKESEYYSDFWNRKEIETVVCGRSPLTWRSELRRLNLIENSRTKKWFAHFDSGIIFSAFGNDVMYLADADSDGDIIFTSSNPDMIEGCYGGIPVTYNKKPTPKTKFDIATLPEFEIKSFGTKIGLITNYSTTLMTMLSVYGENSEEGKEIIKRLKLCRKFQSEQIDLTKGLIVGKIPEWSKRKKDDDLHNSLLTNKRPFFMKYLYSHKSKEYDNHYESYNIFSWMKWGVDMYSLLNLEFKTKEQESLCEKFKRNSPLLVGSNSIMERVSRYMVQNIKEIKLSGRGVSFDYTSYLSREAKENPEIIKKLELLLKEYNQIKKTLYSSEAFENKENAFEYIKGKCFEISYDYQALTDNAVLLCYKYGKNKNFLHDIFSDGVIHNIRTKNKTALVPRKETGGKITHLYENYSMEEVSLT